MTDTLMEAPEAPKPKRKAVRRGGRPRKIATAAPAPKAHDFASITSSKCCDACTPERCAISTVNTCKHPVTTGDAGCGPITMANRRIALKLIKHLKIEQG